MPGRARALWWLYLPSALMLACAIGRATRGWGDFGGYVLAGDSFRGGHYTEHASNTWPPFFSLLAVPLSAMGRLPGEGARLAWSAVTTAAFAFSMVRFWRRARPPNAAPWVAPAALLLIAPFWIAHIVHHQVYGLVFAACAQGFLEAERGRDGRAGLWIGLAAAAKVTPAFTLFYFFFARRFRVILTAALAAALCSLATVPVLGARGALDAHRRWIERASTLRGTFGDRNQSLEALVERWVIRGTSPDVAWIGPILPLSSAAADSVGQLASAALVLAASLLTASRGTRPVEAFATLIAVSVVSAPYCWRSQMVALFPLLLLTLSRIASGRWDVLDLGLIIPFVCCTLEREPAIAGPRVYALLEGAGLTAITYLLVVAEGIRRAGTALPHDHSVSTTATESR